MSDAEHASPRQLQAYVDGELVGADAEAVRAHAAECDTCGVTLAELLATRAILRADPPAEPIRPLWPAVRERILPGTPRRFAWGFALRSSAVAAAGLLLGLLLGTKEPERAAAGTGDLWAELGSTLVLDRGSSLSELYVAELSGEGEETP